MKKLIAVLVIVCGAAQFALDQQYIHHDITVTPGPDWQAAGQQTVAAMQKLADQQKAEQEQRRQETKEAIEMRKADREADSESQRLALEQARQAEGTPPITGPDITAELKSKREELERLEQEIQKEKGELKSELKSDATPLPSSGESIIGAVYSGDLAKIQQLLLDGADVNATNNLGDTALTIAAASEDNLIFVGC